MKLWLPGFRRRRPLAVAVLGSVLFHLLLWASLYSLGSFEPQIITKRGEPLLVDIAPDKPDERAPLGDPSRLPRPVEPEPQRRVEASRPRPAPRPAPKARVVEAPAPKRPTPPAPPPRMVEVPRPAAPPAPLAQPEPSQQVAKASPPPPPPLPAPAPPEPAPPAKVEEPSPAPPEPRQSETASRRSEMVRSEPAPGSAAPPPPSDGESRLALTKPQLDVPPGMFRRPRAGGGLQGGRGGIEGEPIPLDTKDPKYQDYFEKVRQKVKSNWGYPREAGEKNVEGQLLIEFHIAKDGRLTYLELVRSSGTKILDDYALNAIRLSQPFPPVPDNLLAKYVLPVTGMFTYRVIDTTSLLNQFLR